MFCVHLISKNKSLLEASSTQCRRYSTQASQKIRNNSLSSSTSPQRIRNVGIIAHINAGKTTTSERIIHYSGLSDTIGEVDQGNTVTDYLKQERERGITITSAAITFFWSKHKLNLIDTPGHIDFTMEVERSLSVLDGAVTILDSSAGVEAQTIAVWNQANRYSLSNIIYLNKSDKPTANLPLCLHDIKSKLNIEPLLLQIPFKKNGQKFDSLVDLVERSVLTWSASGSCYDNIPVSDGTELAQIVEEKREYLINKLSDMNDDFALHVINCDRLYDVSSSETYKALRSAALERLASPVFIGSSYKNIGIQTLMDGMIKFLPSPLDRLKQIKSDTDNEKVESFTSQSFIGFVFKIIHDKMLGPLTFIRIYRGSLMHQMKLVNLRDSSKESIKKVYQAFADNFQEVRDGCVEVYNIAVVSGLTNVKTGDILVESSFHVSSQAIADYFTDFKSSENERCQFINIEDVYLPNLKRIEPVFYCSIEAPSMLKQNTLEHALECLSREDPSFTYEIEDMGQMIIKGMGKLHIEIIRDRIESEYGVSAHLGPLQISYREAFIGEKEEEINYNIVFDSIKSDVHMKIRLKNKPNLGTWSYKNLKITATAENERIRKDFIKAIHRGFGSALRHGPLLGFEVIDCEIELLEFKASNRCSVAIISSAASKCLTDAVKKCSPVLLEPMMLLEVVIPSEYSGIVLSDLSIRRSLIQSTTPKLKSLTIRSLTPLSELSSYSEYLRVTTSGLGYFTMELYKYHPMTEADRHKIKIT